jgi:predicted enzyme related to lactoylglutathione lyase
MNPLAYFLIHCDDVERGKRFYEAVFGWHIEPWGPPDYYLIFPQWPDRSMTGGLYPRSEPLTGTGLRGFECTFSVAELEPVAAAVVANGGEIDVPEYRIEGVGNLIYFIDTEGNRVGAMKYDTRA